MNKLAPLLTSTLIFFSALVSQAGQSTYRTSSFGSLDLIKLQDTLSNRLNRNVEITYLRASWSILDHARANALDNTAGFYTIFLAISGQSDSCTLKIQNNRPQRISGTRLPESVTVYNCTENQELSIRMTYKEAGLTRPARPR